MPHKPVLKCEWCSEPIDFAGECPNEMCESNLPEPTTPTNAVWSVWNDWSDNAE